MFVSSERVHTSSLTFKIKIVSVPMYLDSNEVLEGRVSYGITGKVMCV